MEMTYQQLLADVRRYKYLCDEGFNLQLARRHQLSWGDARAMEQLAERVAGDVGINWTVAMRGILCSAIARNLLHRGLLTGLVGCPAST